MLQTSSHEALPTNTTSPDEARTARIRALNDQFRRQPFIGYGKFFVTQGAMMDLRDSERMELIQRLTAFDDFTDANDPHDEHDFGALDVGGKHVFWKIDYYDRSMQAASPDPADPAVTCRVLTVMLASEY